MNKTKFFGRICVSVLSTASLAALLGACGNIGHFGQTGSSQGNQATRSVTISIQPGASTEGNRAYGSNPLKVPPGTMVTWVNNDLVAHSATSNNGLWDSKVIAPGHSFSYTFKQPGSFTYRSTASPTDHMAGAIDVSTDPGNDPGTDPGTDPGMGSQNPGGTQTSVNPIPLNPNRCSAFDPSCNYQKQQQQQGPIPKPTKPYPKPKPWPKPTPKPYPKPTIKPLPYPGNNSGGYPYPGNQPVPGPTLLNPGSQNPQNPYPSGSGNSIDPSGGMSSDSSGY